jgi:hypothetical protein
MKRAQKGMGLKAGIGTWFLFGLFTLSSINVISNEDNVTNDNSIDVEYWYKSVLSTGIINTTIDNKACTIHLFKEDIQPKCVDVVCYYGWINNNVKDTVKIAISSNNIRGILNYNDQTYRIIKILNSNKELQNKYYIVSDDIIRSYSDKINISNNNTNPVIDCLEPGTSISNGNNIFYVCRIAFFYDEPLVDTYGQEDAWMRAWECISELRLYL